MKRKKSIVTRGKKTKFDGQSIVVLTFFVIAVIGIIAYNVWNNTPPSTWVSMDEQLPNNKICMVNNAYMGIDQIEVPAGGKMYYGCCEMCVDKLNNNTDSVRYGIDPLTGDPVDKAHAYIVLKSKATSEVYYFESEKTYQKFKERISD